MPIQDSDFCTKYRAATDVNDRIANGVDEFYVRYKNWIDSDSPSSPESMCLYFLTTKDAEYHLLEGEGAKMNGGVRQDHCGVFRTFVLTGCAPFTPDEKIMKELELVRTRSNEYELAFRTTLARYFAGFALTDDEKRILNGALFIRVDLKSIQAGSGSIDRRFYAIPGTALIGFDRNIDGGQWAFIDQQIQFALEAMGSNVINVAGAVQLRFGDSVFPIYKPINVADGMVIMGRA
jgi:hypothetical protein